MEIKGRTALVLGASKGIGSAIAIELAKAGASVVGTSYESVDELALTILNEAACRWCMVPMTLR
jgi:NAD(P)-dependent dehydrogenase (short-subunit alcohol dehydrogenase family)